MLQEWELEARLTDIAIDEGMTSKGDDGSNKVAVKSLLPEVKKAQQDLGAKPIPDEGAPTRFTPQGPRSTASRAGTDQVRIAGPRRRRRIPRCAPSGFHARLPAMKQHHEAIVVGAGVAGIYQIKRLRRPRHRGHRAGGRRRSRRHLVLEPLSRGALRFGELDLRLLLLARASGRMALEGALLRPAREPALPQPRCRQVRPAQVHAVQLPGRQRALRRGRESVAPRASPTGASSPAAS